MTAASASEAQGINVQQMTEFETIRQYEWCFRYGNNGGYEVRNRYSKQGFDATYDNGGNVHLWGYWGGRNQEWEVTP